VLAIVVGVGLAAYLTIHPTQPWILYLVAGLAALAVDGLVRSNPQWHTGGMLASLVFLFLPVLTVIGAGLFIDEAIAGQARLLTAAGGAAAVGIVAYGEYHTVDYGSKLYGPMRLALAVATYLAAFALYTVIFTRHVSLPLAAVLVGAVSLALAMELLRESRLLGPSSLLVGVAIGVSVAELRLALYYFPLDGLLAGALLIIGFYLATGLVHHLQDHDLEWGTTAEYLLVSAVGTAAVVVARAFV